MRIILYIVGDSSLCHNPMGQHRHCQELHNLFWLIRYGFSFLPSTQMA